MQAAHLDIIQHCWHNSTTAGNIVAFLGERMCLLQSRQLLAPSMAKV